MSREASAGSSAAQAEDGYDLWLRYQPLSPTAQALARDRLGEPAYALHVDNEANLAALDAQVRLRSLAGERLRFVFRDTSLYATLLERTLHPDCLRDGADRRAVTGAQVSLSFSKLASAEGLSSMAA